MDDCDELNEHLQLALRDGEYKATPFSHVIKLWVTMTPSENFAGVTAFAYFTGNECR